MTTIRDELSDMGELALGPIGQFALQACIWEATARKPGNVHRYADFDDVRYPDFILSAGIVAPELDRAALRPVGETILAAVHATRSVCATNTNLGIILLLTPLAAVPVDEDLRSGVRRVLDGLTLDDARSAYEAIRLAQPGGLGEVSEADVSREPDRTLLQAMILAAKRDRVARQYEEGFADVFEVGVPSLQAAFDRLGDWESAIITCHLELLATFHDTLIIRKRGQAEAEEAARRARAALAAGGVTTEPGRATISDLDTWLRAEGHQRNPGTTADLVTATLFAALRLDLRADRS